MDSNYPLNYTLEEIMELTNNSEKLNINTKIIRLSEVDHVDGHKGDLILNPAILGLEVNTVSGLYPEYSQITGLSSNKLSI